jgi:hypothetical protein
MYYRSIVSSVFGCGSDTTNVITVDVYEDFLPGSLPMYDTICYLDTAGGITFETLPSGGGDEFTFQWYQVDAGVGNILLPGEDSSYFEPGADDQTTAYFIEVTSSYGCGTLSTNLVTIVVNVLPDTVGIIGLDTVCHYQSGVSYEIAQAAEGHSYLWNCSACTNQSELDSIQLYTYWNGGVGNQEIALIQTIDSTGCKNRMHKDVFVRTESSPEQTEIMKKEFTDLLICSDSTVGLVYEWGYYDSWDDQIYWIPGSNNQFVLLPHVFDTARYSYFVQTTLVYPGGVSCPTISYYNGSPYWDVGVEETTTPVIALFPNPFRDNLTLEFSIDVRKVEVFDIVGSKVYSDFAKPGQREMAIDFTGTNLKSGIYVVVVQMETGSVTSKKIIKW